MEEIERLLCEEIERLNREERRDNRVRFSRQFMRGHPYLFGGMLVSYIPVAMILWYAPYFGLPYVMGFTLFLVAMSLAMSMDINPRYRYEDIDQLDLRVCYNGEWYNSRHVSRATLEAILNSPNVETAVKARIKRLWQTKGALYFYDVFSQAKYTAPPEKTGLISPRPTA
ncbi:YlaC family protein [Dickeya lacustris]|uniref:YlaC family protein n=1 Tax=Dickeya lacustris TaxID=2259638 RepID=A0ABY8GA53_9GAMM|nr:YlaC family protein [Dickeya lacustris]WFN56785.1 YlaC family protein [Dickeya lacustris]